MKPTDILILREIQEVQRRLLAQHIENTERFDQIDEQLDVIMEEVEQSPVENRYVSPELETAIRRVSVLASSIDRKVPG